MKEKSKTFKMLPETYPDLKIGLNDSLADFGTQVMIHSFLSLAPKKQDKRSFNTTLQFSKLRNSLNEDLDVLNVLQKTK